MTSRTESAVARRRIVAAAVQLFGEIGYSATVLGEITDRAHVTKSSFYRHFASKEDLAAAIVEEKNRRLTSAYTVAAELPTGAMESLIRATFAATALYADDEFVRTGVQLTRVLGGFNGEAARSHASWSTFLASRCARAQAEGDVSTSLDPVAAGETVLCTMDGLWSAWVPSDGAGALFELLTRAWEILLVAMVPERALPYFRTFLARRALVSH